MNTGIWIIILIFMIPALFAGLRYFFKKEKQVDIKGAKEDGYFKRYPGSVIEYYRFEEDVHRFLESGRWINGNNALDFHFKELRGLRKTVIYKIPLTHQPQTVYNYYSDQFQKAGFDIVYSALGEEEMGRPRAWFNKLFLTEKNRTAWLDLSVVMDGNIHCYISGKKVKGKAETYVSLFSVNHHRNDKNTGVFVFVTENLGTGI